LGFEKILAKQGTCTQRNAILARCRDEDAIVFFDDDFFPCKDYLAAVERAFREEPDVVMTTGMVVADGIKGPGLPAQAGERLISEAEGEPPKPQPRLGAYNGYGCNMAFRLDAIRSGLLFDERLPQYGWLEDVDFSRRLAPRGRIVKLADARGVHLGSKTGRTPGHRLGYSQMVNPMYLVKKGTLERGRAWRHMWRNLGMNLARSPMPEPYIDRRGRLRGNIRGLVDLLLGRADPERINSFH
jgi:GT2 family glycosyltransferase